MTEELEADTWRQLLTECPYCGQIHEIEEETINKSTNCYACSKTFIPVE